MEALWNLEDKCKLSTREAVLVLASTTIVLVCLCTVTIMKRRTRMKKRTEHGQEPDTLSGGVKQALVGSVRWSKTSKWKESPTPLLRGKGQEGEAGWGSHNSDSPVWQRPILMGDKCEFPTFSGLILYDQRGRPVFDTERDTNHQEIKATVERTTLRDLL